MTLADIIQYIVSPLIVGGLAFLGVWVTNQRSNAVTETELRQLKEEVRKHNGLIERVFHLEGHAGRTDDELKRINKRLEKVEEKGA